MSEGIEIEAVMQKGPIGAPQDLQYFVLRRDGTTDSENLDNWTICTSQTSYRRSFVSDWADEPEGNFITLPQHTLTEEQPRAIFCQNRESFERYYAVSNSAAIFEWRELGDHAMNITLKESDLLQLRLQIKHLPARINSMVAWGDASALSFFQRNDNVSMWDDPNICPAPGSGQALERIGRTNRHTDWVINNNPIPSSVGGGQKFVWISLQLPDFVCSIDNSWTASKPENGQSASISDGSHLDTSGTIQINFEQVQYQKTSKFQILILTRGANGTTASSHQAGTLISHVESNGEAHRRPRVEKLEVRRRRVAGANGELILPTSLVLYGSIYNSPRQPNDDDVEDEPWTYHWQRLYTVADNHQSLRITLDAQNKRWRHLLLMILKMSDGGRAKLNDVLVWLSGIQEVANHEEGSGKIVRALLEEILNPNEISIESGAFYGTTPDRLIAKGKLSGAIEALCKEAGCFIHYTRDGSVRIARKSSHPLGERPAIRAILDYNALRSPHTSTKVSKAKRLQYVVQIQDPATGEIFSGSYPSNVKNAEVISEFLRMACDNESMAVNYAEMRYFEDVSHSDTYNGETVGPAPWMRPGDRIWVRGIDDEAEDGGALRQVRIKSVRHGGRKRNEEFEAVRWRMT